MFKWIQLNVIYATQHRKMELQKDNIPFPKEEMIEKRLFGKTNVYTDGDGVVHEVDEAMPKAQDAVRKRFIMEQAVRTKEVIEELCMLKQINKVMNRAGCTNYQLYQGIDECIISFKAGS